MGDLLRFPTRRAAMVEIFELPNGAWVAGIDLPMDGGNSPKFPTHAEAALFAAGYAAGCGLPVRDWSQSEMASA